MEVQLLVFVDWWCAASLCIIIISFTKNVYKVIIRYTCDLFTSCKNCSVRETLKHARNNRITEWISALPGNALCKHGQASKIERLFSMESAPRPLLCDGSLNTFQ
jgi:hypothetical protein